MEQSSGDGDGGEVPNELAASAKRPNLSPSGADAGEDPLSALPDDILVLILLRLETIAEAARTSALSSRWRLIWTLLPELTFCSALDNRHICEVLAAPEAPALRRILVVTRDDAPDSVATWLPLAARRLSGHLLYHNLVEGHGDEEEEEVYGAIPLPCFVNATAIDLNLGFLALSLPSSGAFARLTELCLNHVWFQGPCELGEIVSSPRCPGLRKLSLHNTRGLANLAVGSDSLLQMDLYCLNGLLQLKIDASALKELTLHRCFVRNQPIADISAPQLVSLHWRDAYDPSSVQLGNLGELQRLGTHFFLVYGPYGNRHNRDYLRLFQRFQFIHTLSITLSYAQEIYNLQYLMDDIKVLPNVMFLNMLVINQGHTFGASSFHVLRLCTGIRRLFLVLHTSRDPEAQSTCPSGCFCDQSPNWKTEELSLNCLQEVEIVNLRGAEHEVVFVKLLFNWAAVLEKIRITFDHSVSKSKAKELCQRLSSLSRPETHVQFFMYHNQGRRLVDLKALGCDFKC